MKLKETVWEPWSQTQTTWKGCYNTLISHLFSKNEPHCPASTPVESDSEIKCISVSSSLKYLPPTGPLHKGQSGRADTTMTVIGLLWSPLYLCATVETALCVFDSECESKAAPPALKQKCHAASLCARREPRGNQNIQGNFVDVRRPRSKRHLSFTKISKKSPQLYNL